MIIKNLSDNIFCDFVSKTLGIDVALYKHDLQIKRTKQGIALTISLGGEMDDERNFYFKDEKCTLISYHINASTKDISYEWIMFLLENCEELTNGEMKSLVDAYNRNIENDISNYASQKREYLIS